MKKEILYLCISLGLLVFSSCSTNNEDSITNDNRILSMEDGIHFKNTIDSISKISEPYIRKGKTRAVNANNPTGIILTEEEKVFLNTNREAMLEASYKMFETIG